MGVCAKLYNYEVKAQRTITPNNNHIDGRLALKRIPNAQT